MHFHNVLNAFAAGFVCGGSVVVLSVIHGFRSYHVCSSTLLLCTVIFCIKVAFQVRDINLAITS